ncbi:MAG TPA: cyclic nucleotide-binding domain-containing protein [Burkholderiales bacterium]|nr:cyclic nucleotide-binding domain-containing protein [Burkholderiales bacterium]
MIEQFQGKEGRTALMDALRRQFLVDGMSEIAEKIASVMQLKEYEPAETLFTQGERGGDLCLLLAGKVSIRVDQQEVAVVNAGMHVGEIGMLEPFKGRSATVVAIDTVVAAHLTQTRFFELAKFHPDLWRRLALELGHRLVDTQRKG